MNQGHSYKKKNWQWQTIIWSSLFLIFGKEFGHWTYHVLGIDQVYSATTSVINQVGIYNEFAQNKANTLQPQLIIDVRNDTPNEYTIDYKIASGHLNFEGQSFSAGEVKRFTIKPNMYSADGNGFGDIVFNSALYSGNNNSICQEVHILNYDLKYANQIKQPLVVNLSSIASKTNCKEALAAATRQPTTVSSKISSSFMN